MGFHHVAITVKDAKASHEFYSGAMGFRLARVEVARAGERGFAKHLFYETGGGGMLALWDLHDPDLAQGWSTAIADGLGLPRWTNHIAFTASDLADLEARKQRWLAHGLDCWEMDHGWCRSIYTSDPNDILVEFCVSTRPFSEADATRALELLGDESPAVAEPPEMIVHRATRRR